MTTVPSPCTGVCRIDPRTALCLGCKRTLQEIADWPMLDAASRRAMLDALSQRHQ